MLLDIVVTERTRAIMIERTERQKVIEDALQDRTELEKKVKELTKAQSNIESLGQSVTAARVQAEITQADFEKFKKQCEGLNKLVITLLHGVDSRAYGDVDPMEAATRYIADLKKAVVELDAKVNELVSCQTELKVCTDTTEFVKDVANKQFKVIAQAEDATNSGWLSKWFSEKKQ